MGQYASSDQASRPCCGPWLSVCQMLYGIGEHVFLLGMVIEFNVADI